MQYRIRTTCEMCGDEFWCICQHPSKLRKTCGAECHRLMKAVHNDQIKYRKDPTPEEITELCCKIRSGEIRIHHNSVTVDSEIKNRRNRASTFFRNTTKEAGHHANRKVD